MHKKGMKKELRRRDKIQNKRNDLMPKAVGSPWKLTKLFQQLDFQVF